MEQQVHEILLVEDDENHIALALRAFSPFKDTYRLYPVRLFREAQRQIDRLQPDLIIADYRLPDGVGMDLLNTPDGRSTLPLILLTSHGDEKLAVAAMKAGILDYVVKSAETFSELPRIANRSIRQWRTMQEHRRAVEELRRHSAAIEQSGDEIIITDSEGSITYSNPAFERNRGLLRSESIGRNVKSFISRQHTDSFYEELWRILGAGQSWKGRLDDRRPDGSPYYNEAHISPIRDSSGVLIGFVWIKRDITSQLALERQLMQAQKTEAIGTLANGIAHDFNNILGAVIGYTEMAMLDASANSAQRINLQRALQACGRAKQLTQQILAFSRQNVEEILCVQVDLIAKEVLQLIRAAIPSNIEIKANLKSQACVLANPAQVHQILMNLCSNAAYAMQGSGGVLRIDLEEAPFSAVRAEPFQAADTCLVIRVKDNGGGIAPEHLDRIFDPFFTTKSPGKGTGLGLSVVNNIVTGCGGYIEVDNHPGKGVAFNVFLPISGERPKDESASLEPVPGGSEHIFFIDDEAFLTDIGEQILTRLGYQVSVSNDSAQALESFRQNPDSFDLVITDLTMPRITGDLLAEQMLAIRPDLPIILCTGLSEKLTRDRVRQIGIRALALKPVVLKELAFIIREALGETVDRGTCASTMAR